MIIKTLRKTPDIFPLEHVRVVDGDTLEADIILPFKVHLRKSIRLKGFWADELDGPYRSQGLAARLRLEHFVADKALWLHAPSCRLDKYGRAVGLLMHGERIISGREVLGELQLTEKDHKDHKDAAKLSAKQGKAFIGSLEGIKTAGWELKRVLGHPSANYATIVGVPARIHEDASLGDTHPEAQDDRQYGPGGS